MTTAEEKEEPEEAEEGGDPTKSDGDPPPPPSDPEAWPGLLLPVPALALAPSVLLLPLLPLPNGGARCPRSPPPLPLPPPPPPGEDSSAMLTCSRRYPPDPEATNAAMPAGQSCGGPRAATRPPPSHTTGRVLSPRSRDSRIRRRTRRIARAIVPRWRGAEEEAARARISFREEGPDEAEEAEEGGAEEGEAEEWKRGPRRPGGVRRARICRRGARWGGGSASREG